eukprot:TRINITY_DN516_c0_g5_i1.p1 TRINITY_DN516_c0_g5~~TRINITY_DN516_c0_g5_i1.p1  ORF type:complete len:687 (+),score=186.47 TRINITY_DN516_c0_g5_i1:48-2063(+)
MSDASPAPPQGTEHGTDAATAVLYIFAGLGICALLAGVGALVVLCWRRPRRRSATELPSVVVQEDEISGVIIPQIPAERSVSVDSVATEAVQPLPQASFYDGAQTPPGCFINVGSGQPLTVTLPATPVVAMDALCTGRLECGRSRVSARTLCSPTPVSPRVITENSLATVGDSSKAPSPVSFSPTRADQHLGFAVSSPRMHRTSHRAMPTPRDASPTKAEDEDAKGRDALPPLAPRPQQTLQTRMSATATSVSISHPSSSLGSMQTKTGSMGSKGNSSQGGASQVLSGSQVTWKLASSGRGMSALSLVLSGEGSIQVGVAAEDADFRADTVPQIGGDEGPEPLSPSERYEPLAQLGAGNFGKVLKVRGRRDGSVYALKYIRCGEFKSRDAAVSEARLLASVERHPNIVTVVETFIKAVPPRPGETSDSCYVCIVMPYFSEGDLKNMCAQRYSGGTPAEVVANAARQLGLGLSHLHSRTPRLIHMDLKPENVLVMERGRRLVLADFGLAREMFESVCDCSTVGTLAYSAPEMWRKQYGVWVDMWSLGCVLHAMTTGWLLQRPLRVLSMEHMRPSFRSDVFAEVDARLSSSLLANIVAALLEPDHRKRLAADELLRLVEKEAPSQAGSPFDAINPLVKSLPSPGGSHHSAQSSPLAVERSFSIGPLGVPPRSP